MGCEYQWVVGYGCSHQMTWEHEYQWGEGDESEYRSALGCEYQWDVGDVSGHQMSWVREYR